MRIGDVPEEVYQDYASFGLGPWTQSLLDLALDRGLGLRQRPRNDPSGRLCQSSRLLEGGGGGPSETLLIPEECLTLRPPAEGTSLFAPRKDVPFMERRATR